MSFAAATKERVQRGLDSQEQPAAVNLFRFENKWLTPFTEANSLPCDTDETPNGKQFFLDRFGQVYEIYPNPCTYADAAKNRIFVNQKYATLVRTSTASASTVAISTNGSIPHIPTPTTTPPPSVTTSASAVFIPKYEAMDHVLPSRPARKASRRAKNVKNVAKERRKARSFRKSRIADRDSHGCPSCHSRGRCMCFDSCGCTAPCQCFLEYVNGIFMFVGPEENVQDIDTDTGIVLRNYYSSDDDVYYDEGYHDTIVPLLMHLGRSMY